MADNSSQKGSILERAVEAIETTVLERNPELRGQKFTIERRKLIVAHGVKHEIDVFVSIPRGGGYDATFIFECKNLAENVGKNDIIVFSEKIQATAATRGFFVAKGFGEYARAQAGKDPRITLLDATETLSHIEFLTTFSVEVTIGSTLQVRLHPRKSSTLSHPTKRSAVNYGGERKSFDEFINLLMDDLTKQRTAKSDVHTLSPGEHTLLMDGTLNFEQNALIVDDVEITTMDFHLTVGYKRLFPKFKTGFEVAGRGRYFEFENVEIAPGRTLENIRVVC